ncbi:MAG: hypothetical protein EBS01_10585, partial [Verrucomicrobia bacterium]|nr:hypothetical protein [Verrucomicrobiota bacterium]
EKVAQMVGARRVSPETRDPLERRLLNVVEEMAIASGLRVPPVYVMEDQSINAFAAGNDSASAVIGVTKGALERLTPEELRAVLLHEFSHILSGDMRLKFRMLVWVQGILFLSLAGRLLVASDSPVGKGFWGLNASAGRRAMAGKLPGNADGESQSRSILGVLLMMLGSVTGVFGRFLQGTISRDLEFAADAAAAGCLPSAGPVVSALRKIGGLPEGSVLSNPTAPESGHLFFAPASVGFSSVFFPTHPTLGERILRLMPEWNGDYLSSRVADDAVNVEQKALEAESPAEPLSAAAKAAAAIGAKKREKMRSRASLSYPVGNLEFFGKCMLPSHLSAGASLKRTLREEWVRNAQNRDGAKQLLLEIIKPSEVAALQLGTATPTQLFLLLDLAMPMLRRMDQEEYHRLMRRCRREVVRPDEIELSRFVLLHTVRRRLGIALGVREVAPVVFEELPSVWTECRVLIASMIQGGSRSAAMRSAARVAAWGSLGYEVPPPLDGEPVSVGRVVAALQVFEQASASLRKQILVACGFAGATQGFLMDREMALVRMYADSMGCPVPHLEARNMA